MDSKNHLILLQLFLHFSSHLYPYLITHRFNLGLANFLLLLVLLDFIFISHFLMILLIILLHFIIPHLFFYLLSIYFINQFYPHFIRQFVSQAYYLLCSLVIHFRVSFLELSF